MQTYPEARAALIALHAQLQLHDPRAANSPAEGLEETLTLHKLELVGKLGGSLQTTNLIENVNSRLGARRRRVKRWVNSVQRQRWVAMAIVETDPRLRRIPGADHLPKLQKPLAERVPKSYIASILNRLRPLAVN